jgi:hypothetical protein
MYMDLQHIIQSKLNVKTMYFIKCPKRAKMESESRSAVAGTPLTQGNGGWGGWQTCFKDGCPTIQIH